MTNSQAHKFSVLHLKEKIRVLCIYCSRLSVLGMFWGLTYRSTSKFTCTIYKVAIIYRTLIHRDGTY